MTTRFRIMKKNNLFYGEIYNTRKRAYEPYTSKTESLIECETDIVNRYDLENSYSSEEDLTAEEVKYFELD